MLKDMEAERRVQEITENNTMMFKEELYNFHGEHEMQSMQQQHVINDLLPQMQTPYGPIRSDTKPKPLFPQDPVLQQHLRAVETSQQSKQAPAPSSKMTQNHLMSQKDLLDDLGTTMEYQQKH